MVAHFDLDAFFASVEERSKPWLKGKPVVVGGLGGRGVVSTCNYEARRYGVRSAMPVSKARGLCTRAVFVPPDFDLYSKVSQGVAQTIFSETERFHSAFEQASIDEFFVEFECQDEKKVAEVEAVLREARKKIFLKHGVACTVGVASNKLVSKIACAQAKPDGFKLVPSGGEKTFLEPLPVGELWGVGGKTREKLELLGVKAIGELARRDVMLLLDEFGSLGAVLHFSANGVDNSKVGGEWKAKSVGAERTFERDVGNFEAAEGEASALSRTVHAELSRKNFFFKRITLKARFSDFETRTIARTLRQSTDSLEKMEEAVLELLQKAFREGGGKKLRLLGVRASELSEMRGQLKLEQFARSV